MIYINCFCILLVDEEVVHVNFRPNANSTSHIPLSLTLNRNQDYKDQVVERIQHDKLYYKRGVDYSFYELTNDHGQAVLGVPTRCSSAQYWFSLPQKIIAECASNWNDEKLQQLRIEFEDVTAFSELFKPFTEFTNMEVSAEGRALKLEHRDLTAKMVEDFRTSNAPLMELVKDDSLAKVIVMVGKYRTVEALVDLFVCFLLLRLGYYKGRLFAFPQFPHSIHFGTETCDAVPDFTIMDICTYYRAFIFEEKSDASTRPDSSVEAQVIAEAIAVFQSSGEITNTTDASQLLQSSSSSAFVPKENVILGVKVKGTVFTFYSIPISNQILNALSTCRAASMPTTVTRYGNLDYKVEEQRDIIITVLDMYKQMIEVLGERSARRPSGVRK